MQAGPAEVYSGVAQKAVYLMKEREVREIAVKLQHALQIIIKIARVLVR